MEKALEVLKEIMGNKLLYFQLARQDFSIMRINEAIAELEEAMKPKTCNECEWWDFNSYGIFKKCFNGKGNCVSTKSSFGCNRFKQKDNAC